MKHFSPKSFTTLEPLEVWQSVSVVWILQQVAWEAWVTNADRQWQVGCWAEASQGEQCGKVNKVTVTMLQLLSLFPGWNTRLLLGEFPWFQSPKDPNLFCMPSQILLSGVDRAPLPFWQGISLPGWIASTNSYSIRQATFKHLIWETTHCFTTKVHHAKVNSHVFLNISVLKIPTLKCK